MAAYEAAWGDGRPFDQMPGIWAFFAVNSSSVRMPASRSSASCLSCSIISSRGAFGAEVVSAACSVRTAADVAAHRVDDRLTFSLRDVDDLALVTRHEDEDLTGEHARGPLN